MTRGTRVGVVLPVGPGEDGFDAVESVFTYIRDARLVVVDDTGQPGFLQKRLGRWSGGLDIMRAPARAVGGQGGLWVKVQRGLRRLVAVHEPDVVLKLDSDALVTGNGLAEAALEALAGSDAGILGAARVGPDGGQRDWEPAAQIIRRESGVWGWSHPALRRRLARLTRQAVAAGYVPGEHALGGAYILSPALARYLAQAPDAAWAGWARSGLGEDHICGLLARAGGWSIKDWSGPEHPMAVTWRGMVLSPEAVAERNKLVVHSTRAHGDLSEAEIQSSFRHQRAAFRSTAKPDTHISLGTDAPPAYLLLVHRDPGQVRRLVQRLLEDGSHVFVHVDRRQPSDVFIDALADLPRVMVLEERVRSGWARYGLVEASLILTRYALETCNFSHAVLMSGQDYPIRSARARRRLLSDHADRSFLSWSRGGDPKPATREGNQAWYWDGDRQRLERRYYWLGNRNFRLPNRFLPWVPLRRAPEGMDFYQGSQWWALDRLTAEFCVDQMRSRPDLERFFRRVLAPDENVFQMLIMNSPLAERVVNEDLRYQDLHGWHPRVLDHTDLEKLARSEKYFARKFDMARHPEVLSGIDQSLLVDSESVEAPAR